MLSLLKHNPTLRRFFAAFFQSQVGTWAAYVALLLLAYQRLHSAWAISLVLLGDFLPGIALAPLFGTLADRVSRRRLVVCADLLRGGCFIGVALIPSFVATIGLVLLAGVGSALFRPAINAALPGLVAPEERSRLTALFYAAVNTGLMIGPAAAAGLLLISSAPVVLIANAATFLVSALMLGGIDLGPHGVEPEAAEEAEQRSSVWSETQAGVRTVARLPGVPVLMSIAALVVLTGAMFNVVAPLLAVGPLHAGGSGYGMLMTLYGGGMVAGSWVNARAGSDVASLRRRWLLGIALSGATIALAGVAPNLAVAVVAFAFIGLGENLLVGPEIRLMQEMVAERLHGRAFALKDVLENIAFVVAFTCTGALLALAGTRVVFVASGLLTLGISLLGAIAFRERRAGEPVLASS
jgi:MFS family permease